jgi:AsmA protein
MSRWLKWLIGAAVVVALLVVGAFVLVSNLDGWLNENREWVQQRAEETLGRPVRFASLGTSLWGGLGVRVDGLAVAEDPAFGEGDFVAADTAIVKLRIWPALFGRYEVSRVVLEEPSVTVVRTARGFNFSTLAGSGGEPAAEEKGGAAAVLVAFLDIDGGTVRFVDRTVSPPLELVAERIDFTASDVSTERPVELECQASVLGAPERNLFLSGRVGPVDLDAPARSPLRLKLGLAPLPLDALQRLPELAAALPPELAVQGALETEISLEGALEKLSLAARVDAEQAQVRYAESFRKPQGVAMRARAEGVYEGDTLRLDSLELVLGEAAIEGSGRIVAGERVEYDLALESRALPLAGWERLAPALETTSLSGAAQLRLDVKGTSAQTGLPTMQGTLALDDVAVRAAALPPVTQLSTTIRLEKGRVVLPATRLRVADAPVEVEASVDDLASPHGRLAVRAESLPAAVLGLGEEDGKDEALRGLDLDATWKLLESGPALDARLASASGRLYGLEYSDLRGRLRYADGRATLEETRARVYEGALVASGRYEPADDGTPRFALQSRLENVQTGALLASRFPGAGALLTGRLNADLSLDGRGSAWEQIQRALTGRGTLRLDEGRLRDVNLVESILRQMTGVTGLSGLLSPKLRQEYPAVFGTGETRFQSLDTALEVREGRVRLPDLRLSAHDYGLTASGQVSLTGEVDLDGRLLPSPALTGALVGEARPLRFLTTQGGRLEVPFRLRGPVTGVRVEPDLEYVAQTLQRNLLSGLVEGALEAKPPRALEAKPSRKEPEGGEGAAKAEPKPERPEENAEEVLRRGLEGILGR